MSAGAERRLLNRDFLIKVLLVLVVLLAAPWILRLVDMRKAVERETRSFEEEPLGLKQIVRQVKQELAEADLEGANEGEMPLFNLDHFDLELNVVVQERARAGVKAAPQLLVVDKETEIGAQKIQKIHLHWKVNPGVRRSKQQREFDTEGATPLRSPPPTRELPDRNGEDHG